MSFTRRSIFTGIALLILSLFAGAAAIIHAAEQAQILVTFSSSPFLDTTLVKGEKVNLGSISFYGQRGNTRIHQVILRTFGDVDDNNIKIINLVEPGGAKLGPATPQNTLVLFDESFLLEERQTRSFDIEVELENNIEIGKTLGIKIISGGNVKAEEQFTDHKPAEILGDFPFATTEFIILDQSSDTVVVVKEISDGDGFTVFRGEKNYIFGKMKFSVYGERDIYFTDILMRPVGTAGLSALENIRLVSQQGELIAKGIADDTKVRFKTPFSIRANTSQTLLIQADISSDVRTDTNVKFELFTYNDIQAYSAPPGDTFRFKNTFPVRTPLITFADPTARIVLHSDTPISQPIVAGKRSVEFARFEVQGDTKPITIDRITLHRLGSMQQSKVENPKLVSITTGDSMNIQSVTQNTMTFGGSFSVPALGSMVFAVRGDMADTAVFGEGIGYEIQNKTDVHLADAENYSSDLQGVFPLRGNIMTVGNELQPEYAQIQFLPPEPVWRKYFSGVKNTSLAHLQMTAPHENLEIKNITLEYMGTFPAEKITNVFLADAYGNIVSDVRPQVSGDVTFDLLVPLRKEEPTDLYVYGDLGFHEESGTVAFTLPTPESVRVDITKNEKKAGIVGDFPLTSPVLEIGSLGTQEKTVFLSSVSQPIGIQASGAQDVLLGSMEFFTYEEGVTLSRLLLQQIGTQKGKLEKVKLVQSGITVATHLSGETTDVIAFYDFAKKVELTPGEKTVVDIYGNIGSPVDSDKTIQFNIVSEGYIEMKKFGGVAVNVTSNFPLIFPALRTPTVHQSLYCDTDEEVMCGRIYNICDTYPCGFEEITYTNICKLEEAHAFALYQGNCRERLPDLPPAEFSDMVLEDVTAYEASFSDVDADSLEGRAASELFRRKAINGFPDGEFKGSRDVNRAEIVKFLLLTKYSDDEIVSSQEINFRDTETDAWYVKYIAMALEKGIIEGYKGLIFRPASPVNTAEFLKMMTITFNLERNKPFRYLDVNGDDWFAEYAHIAQTYDMFPKRRQNYLEPGKEMTRTEVSVAIYQYLKNREATP